MGSELFRRTRVWTGLLCSKTRSQLQPSSTSGLKHHTARAAAGLLNRRRNRSRRCQGRKILNAGNREPGLSGLYARQEPDQEAPVPSSCHPSNLMQGRKGEIMGICAWVLLPLQPPTSCEIPSKPISATHSPSSQWEGLDREVQNAPQSGQIGTTPTCC